MCVYISIYKGDHVGCRLGSYRQSGSHGESDFIRTPGSL